jgi:predicted NAD/FAD-dependent oxidoreductase
MRRVVIIGAGLTGLSAATSLAARGFDVTVVEKGRGPGGRMSTRRSEPYRFDHGAQYLTARDPRFQAAVDDWLEKGLLAVWQPRIGVFENGEVRSDSGSQIRYVGVPGMSAICRALAAALDDCRFSWRAETVRYDETGWLVRSDRGEVLRADELIVTAPPVQTDRLLEDAAVSESIRGVSLQPCWALMAVFERSPLPGWDAAFVNTGPLSWIASQASKPGRTPELAWVLHASPEWSDQYLEQEPDRVRDMLLDALRSLPGASGAQPIYARAHRWRYSIAAEPLDVGCIRLGEQNLTIAGDWCAGSRIEGAYLSGLSAAAQVGAT